ncbi:MAG: hypothetical protein KC438_02940 [Thermomicrobiales bacterium]|nr:hypothetical protein [Thermomicrobiales bacterium]MCO5221913.1 hypothetical protein [Thermomicrobiales bacterium]
MPSERLLAALLVGLLVLIILPWRHSTRVTTAVPENETVIAAVDQTPTSPPGEGSETSDGGDPGQTEALEPAPTERVEETQVPEPTIPPTEAPIEVSPTSDPALAVTGEYLLPAYRVLSFYGFPGEPNMGILGEYDMQTLLERLKQQAEAYQAVDDRPYKLAFEVIASVAQQYEGEDGDHLAYIGEEQLQEYIDFTAANDLLLILDVQFGRRSVQQEVAAMEQYLEYPHVHLALDPEFAVDEGEVPGTVIGSIDAADVLYAQQELARISAENGLPPKLLIVHQFTESSISNREQITQIPGVQFVLEVDGFGTPDEKRSTFAVLTAGEAFDFHGFKLWYNLQDDPIMSPEEVLALDPQPDLIIYQ